SAVDFSADNSKMVAWLGQNLIEVLDLPAGKHLESLPSVDDIQRARDVACVRFDWAGQQIGNSALGNQRVQIQNWKGLTTSYPFRRGDITALAWSPEGRQIAIAYNPGAIDIWDLNLNKARSLPRIHSEAVRDLAFSPDSTMLASLGGDRTLILWCQGTGRNVALALDTAP